MGAGPAGLACAIALARRGRRVLVCDSGRLPQSKACGEGVMPTGVGLLEQLGVLPHVRVFRAFRGLRFVSPRGAVARAGFRSGSGLGMTRGELSRALVSEAEGWPSLAIEESCRLRGLEPEGTGWRALLSSGPLRVPLVVGADGLGSTVRRLAGLDRPASSGWFHRWGASGHFRLEPWSDSVEVYWQAGVEAYVTPVGEHLVSVAVLWDRDRLGTVQGGTGLMDSLLERFPELRGRLAAAPAEGPVLAVGPLHRRVRRVTAPGLALVGDASGYLDALTGEGISLGLAQALALAETLEAGRPLSDYARSHARLVRPYYRVTGALLLAARFPRLLERLIRALASEPESFDHLLEVSLGRARLAHPSLLRLLLRLVVGA